MKLITKGSSTLQHFINGQFQDSLSGETFETTNPATQEVLAQVSRGQKEDVNLAVKAAQQAFDSGVWSQTAMKERCRILRKIGDLILENQRPLAEAETLDTGKPITESFEGDIPRSAANFHFFADDAMAYREEAFTIDALERHFAVREPLGVVGLITPWNLP
ncbi:MAG: aldehyde dehydrogenase family protein, partial [Cyanobacteria bacterium]|nr:aldehyde dehydrogenase family protein [Cyanobacteriota bacterium]